MELSASQERGFERAQSTKSVVIVDDSRTLRAWLRVVLERDPKLQVVGEAGSAQEAREVIKRTNPDVITLDIEMPGMSGLAFLEKLMSLFPKPVVMISGSTRVNSEVSITALSLGAVDCILKPMLDADERAQKDIRRRVFSAACSQVQAMRRQPPSAVRAMSATPSDRLPLILIGASTGGVAALERVLADVHVDGPPVVIVQHMPGAFLVSFAQLLNRHLGHDVAIARAGEVLSRGQIRLAPAVGQHTVIHRELGKWSCRFAPNDGNSLHCPSVDMLFSSATAEAKDIIGVILTGLGSDGATGLLALHESGAATLGQDRASSVVYGMPRVAWERGAVDKQLPLDRLGAAINRAVAVHSSKIARS